MAKKTAKKEAAGKRLTVTLVRSPIGFNKTQGKTVEGMGLRRIRHSWSCPTRPRRAA
jgi:ribosomal protein L30/L7E